MTALHIKTDGTIHDTEADTLEQMQKGVGGYIEVVTQGEIAGTPYNWVLYGNEEGMLLDLPVNPVARMLVAVAHQVDSPEIQELHGNFVLRVEDENENTAPVPEELRQVVEKVAGLYAETGNELIRIVRMDEEGNQ